MLPSITRRQSRGEELANSISHGAGLVAALVGAPILIHRALQIGGPANVVGASVFAGTTILLYLASTLYHAVPHARAKGVLRMLDHGAIFLLIAGTYTPFTLGVLRGPGGWALFGIVWGLAVVGVSLKFTTRLHHPVLSTGLYLAMGWLAVVAARPFWQRVPLPGLLWLLAGGVAYTAGTAFFAAKHLRFGHLAWHLCVLAGTVCHYFAVLGYAF
jgi:hemolysin III